MTAIDVPPDPAPYRMKELSALTGLSRQAIHFYIQEGLVPEGHKTGRNMAWYGPEHVERLRLVRRLQEERFLPLKAIRALVSGEASHLAASQRGLLLEVKARLPAGLVEDTTTFVALADAAARHDVAVAEIERMVSLGLIAARDHDGRREVAASSLWLLETWAQIRTLGLAAQIQFSVDDLAIYEETIANLFQRETKILAERLAGQAPERLAGVVEQILPLLHTILIHFHTAAVRSFFGALDATPTPEAP